jgi:hypothetical protein
VLLSRSVSPSVEHLARAAREDLHLRASVIMQVPEPAVSASQRKKKILPQVLVLLPPIAVCAPLYTRAHTHTQTHTHTYMCVCVRVCVYSGHIHIGYIDSLDVR